MPTYLCHGFRWQRRSIRVFVVVQNLDDASPEWIVRPASAFSVLESFYNLFDFLPDCRPPRTSSAVGGRSRTNTLGSSTRGDDDRNRARSRSQSRGGRRDRSQSQSQRQSQSRSRRPTLQTQTPPASLHDDGDDVLAQDWSTVKLLEEYDPLDLTAVSQPYAYVADYAVRIDLSCSVVEEIARYEERARASPDPPVTGPSSDETLRRRDTSKKGGKKAGWFEKLRDQLQRGEEIRWYVVVNGDEERAWPAEPPGAEDTAAARAQQTHHAQYTNQQLIFEDKDAVREREREKLRREMGYDQPAEREPRPPRERRPRVPDKELPPILTKKASMDQGGLRPKTPKTGGFRRLFGRSKAGGGDETP